MRRVLSLEIRKAFCGRWFAIAVAIALVLAGLAAVESINQFEVIGFNTANTDAYPYYSSWSCYAAWLGVGAWGRAGFYYLFFYGMVFIAPFAYSWSSVTEMRSGYYCQEITRCPRWQYYFSKLIASFCASAAVAAIALLSNMIFVACYFPAFMPNAYDSLYTGMTYSEVFADVFYSNPAFFVFLRTLFDSCLCGAWGALVLSIGWFVKRVSFALILPYFFLLILEFCNHFFFAALTSVPIFEFSIFQRLQGWSFEYAHEPIISVSIVALLILLSAVLAFSRNRSGAR